MSNKKKILRKIGIVILVFGALAGLNFVLDITVYNPAVAVPAYEWLAKHNLVETYKTAEHLGNLNEKNNLYPLVSISAIQKNLFFFPRASVIGTVIQKVKTDDGDWHVNVADDNGRVMVTEIVPELSMPVPPLNAKIKIWGVTRYDLEHRWWELHPVIGWENSK